MTLQNYESMELWIMKLCYMRVRVILWIGYRILSAEVLRSGSSAPVRCDGHDHGWGGG